ncbi:hypothetical protein DdX_13444 [Ditylenchus destructor]|uniref:Uncharacterized protein n=1 Tax=Ditylenchus destructor TaxID=166010 RepID=A0AAD4MWG2_9BILA|nr:hypothetical protein DdX_13444 [Ditylenchus destructor]
MAVEPHLFQTEHIKLRIVNPDGSTDAASKVKALGSLYVYDDRLEWRCTNPEKTVVFHHSDFIRIRLSSPSCPRVLFQLPLADNRKANFTFKRPGTDHDTRSYERTVFIRALSRAAHTYLGHHVNDNI